MTRKPSISQILNTKLTREGGTIGSFLTQAVLRQIRADRIDIHELEVTLVANGWVEGKYIMEDEFSYIDEYCPGETEDYICNLIQEAFNPVEVCK